MSLESPASRGEPSSQDLGLSWGSMRLGCCHILGTYCAVFRRISMENVGGLGREPRLCQQALGRIARLHQRDYVHPSSQAGEVQLAQEWVWLDPGCSTHGQGNISAAQGGTRGTWEDDCGNRSQIPSTKTGFISRNCTATANPPSPKSTTASNGSPQMLMAFVVVV